MARVLYDDGSPTPASDAGADLDRAARAIGTIAALRRLHRPVAVPTAGDGVPYFCLYDFQLWPCSCERIVTSGMGDGTERQDVAALAKAAARPAGRRTPAGPAG
jgi:hypothetical protein